MPSPASSRRQLEQDLPHGREEWRTITGLPVSTYFSAVKLLWLLREVPAVREAVDEGDAMFGTVDSWILWNMTGGRVAGRLAGWVGQCEGSLGWLWCWRVHSLPQGQEVGSCNQWPSL